MANLQNLQALQGLQIRPQQVGSVAQTLPPPQGQGLATAQLVRTPQGQQIIIQHAPPPPQGGTPTAPNQNIILRTIPSGVIQIPGGVGTAGVGISQGVVGTPGLGIIQQVAQPGQQACTNIVQPPTMTTNLTTQPGQPPPATHIQGPVDQSKGMLTINVGGQNINIGQLNLQQLKSVPAGGMNLLPNPTQPAATTQNQLKQAQGLQFSNLQAQIAQLQALQQQQQQLVGAVQNGQLQTMGPAPLLQQNAASTGVTQTQLQNIPGMSGQTVTVLPPQTLSLPSSQAVQQQNNSNNNNNNANVVVAQTGGLVQMSSHGLVLGPQGVAVSNVQLTNTATSVASVTTTQAAQNINMSGVVTAGKGMTIAQNSSGQPLHPPFQSINQKPIAAKPPKPTEPVSNPDPLQAALMESQIGPLDSEIITAPPNQIAPVQMQTMSSQSLQSSYQNSSSSAHKPNAESVSLSLPSTAVVFPQQPQQQTMVCSAPQMSASVSAQPAKSLVVSSNLQLAPPVITQASPVQTTPTKLPLPPRRPIQIRPATPNTSGVNVTTSTISVTQAQPITAKSDLKPAKPVATVQPTSATSAGQNVRLVQNAMNAAQSAVQAAQLQAQSGGQAAAARVQTIALNPHTQQMLVKVQNRIRTLQKTESRTTQEEQELQKLVEVYQKIIQQARLQAQQLVQQQAQQPATPGGQPVIPQPTATLPALSTGQVLSQPVSTLSFDTKSQPQTQQLKFIQPNLHTSSTSTSTTTLLSQPQVVTVSAAITTTAPSIAQNKPIAPAQPGLLLKTTADTSATNTAAAGTAVTAQPGKLPIPANANIAQIRVGNQIIHVQAELKEKAQAQLAKLTPEQQQLFFKHQQALLAQRQRLQQQQQQQQQSQAGCTAAGTATNTTTTSATTATAKLPIPIQPAGKLLPQLKPLAVAGGQAVLADRGIKRPAPPPTLSKAALILQSLTQDHNLVLKPASKPFKNRKDAVRQLLRYHVFHTPDPLPAQLYKEDENFEDQSRGLLKKFSSMLEKYRSLLHQESMRAAQTSEMVMIERIFLNDEKENFESEKKLAVEDPDTFVPVPMPVSSSVDEDESDPDDSREDESPIKQHAKSESSKSGGSMCAVRSSSSKDGLKIVIKNLQNAGISKSDSKSKHHKHHHSSNAARTLSDQSGATRSSSERGGASSTAENSPMDAVSHRVKTEAGRSSPSNAPEHIKTEPVNTGYPDDTSLPSVKLEAAAVTDSVKQEACPNGLLMDFLRKDDDETFLSEVEGSKLEDEAYIQDVVSPQLPFSTYTDRQLMKPPPAAAALYSKTNTADCYKLNKAHTSNADTLIAMPTGMQASSVAMARGGDGDGLQQVSAAQYGDASKSSAQKTGTQKQDEISSAVDSIAGLFDDVSDAVNSQHDNPDSYTAPHSDVEDEDDFDMAEFERLQSGHSMDYADQPQSELDVAFSPPVAGEYSAQTESQNSLSEFIDQNLTESSSGNFQDTEPADSLLGTAESSMSQRGTPSTNLSSANTGISNAMDHSGISEVHTSTTGTPSSYHQHAQYDMSHSTQKHLYEQHSPELTATTTPGGQEATPHEADSTSADPHPNISADVLAGFSQKSDFSMFEEDDEEEGFGEQLNEQVESAINSILSLQQLDALPAAQTATQYSPHPTHAAALHTGRGMLQYSQREELQAAADSMQQTQQQQAAGHESDDDDDDDDMQDDLDAAVQSILL